MTNGDFGSNGYYGIWWASTECSYIESWNYRLSYTNGNAVVGYYDKRKGFSVRCLRD